MWHIWSLCCKSSKKQVICQLGKERVCKSRVRFLRTCVVLGRGEAQPKKFESIKEWQSRVLAKGIKSFLGLTNSYKSFIKNFFTLAKPPTDLLKKKGLFEWEDEQQSFFDLLKRKLSSTPIDAPPNSLKDSNASLKVEIMEKWIGVDSLTCNTLGVKGHARAPGWGLR